MPQDNVPSAIQSLLLVAIITKLLVKAVDGIRAVRLEIPSVLLILSYTQVKQTLNDSFGGEGHDDLSAH